MNRPHPALASAASISRPPPCTTIKGTRAAGAAKGLLLLSIVVAVLSRVIGGPDVFQRLAVLYDRLLALVAIALIVIFQPELRRALVRLGEAPFM